MPVRELPTATRESATKCGTLGLLAVSDCLSVRADTELTLSCPCRPIFGLLVNFSGHCGDGGSGGKEVWVEKGQQLIAGWLIGPLHPRGDTRQLPLTGRGHSRGGRSQGCGMLIPARNRVKAANFGRANHPRTMLCLTTLPYWSCCRSRSLAFTVLPCYVHILGSLPGTGSSLNVTWTVWLPGWRGPKDTPNLAPPRASTWVDTFTPVGEETRISRLPSPASPASTVRNQVLS